MISILFGIFIILHGLVHLLYFGHARRFFELQPGFAWPDGAWTFSHFLSNDSLRATAGILLVVAALGFVIGGIGILGKFTWWQSIASAAAILSSVIYFLFWNGKFQHLDNQGIFGILINAAILVAALIFRWPGF